MADIANLLKTVQGVTNQYQSNEPVSEGFLTDLAGGAIDSIRAGVADFNRVLQKVSDAMSNAATGEGAPADRLQIFKQLADSIAPKDFEDQVTLARKFGRVFGGLLVGIPKYAPLMALGPAAAIPAFAGVEAATAWGRDAPPEEIMKEAALGGAFGGLLGPVGSKLARWPRALATGAGSTAIAVAGGETNPVDLAITGFTMGTMGVLGPGKPHNLQAKLNKLGYPNEVIKKISMKDAREYARNNQRFVAPEPIITPTPAPTTIPTPAATWGDLPGLLGKEQTSQIDAIKNSDLIYDKILLGRKFTEEQVASMPLATKLAIANGGHNASTIKVEPISGRITLTGKAPETTKITEGATVAPGTLPGFGGTVEDLVIDPTREASLINAVKDVSSRIGVDLGEVPEPVAIAEPATTVKPVVANKEIVNQLKWKFGITEADAKKSAILLAEKGITIPSDATTFFESIPKLPKGQKLTEHIRKQEPTAQITEETKATKQLAVETAKFESRQPTIDLENVQDRIKKAENKLTLLSKKEALEQKAVDKSGLVKVQTAIKDTTTILDNLNTEKDTILSKIEVAKPVDIGAGLAKVKTELAETDARIAALGGEAPVTTEQAIEMGKKLSKEERMTVWQQYKAERDPFKKQMLREQVEASLGATGKKSLTPEAIEAKLVGKRRNVTVKELAKETTGAGAKTPEEINREQLIGKASMLWPNRRADLVLLADADLQKIVDKTILPQQASITQSGKLIEIAAGDKALAVTLDIPVTEAAKVRDTIQKESPINQEGLLRTAANFLDVPYKTVAGLSEADKQSVINTYLQNADKNIEKAQKLGDIVDKGKIEATKVYNEVISKNPNTDITLAKLNRKYTELKRKEAVAKASYGEGLIDKADLDLLTNDKTEALRAIEKRRNEIKSKAAKELTTGDSLFVSSLAKDDSGGIVVIKKISDNMDEFQLLTKIGKSPIPGDTGLNIAGRVRVETAEGKPIKIEFPTTLDIPQQDFFKEQFKKSVQSYYEKKGFGLPEGGGLRLRTGIDVDLAKEMASRLKQKTVSIYQGFAERRGVNKRISKEEMPSVMKDIMDGEKLKLSEDEIAMMHADMMGEGITKVPTTVGAPTGIPKGDIPMVKPTDMLGQSMANANPDIRQLAEKAVQNEIRKRYLKEQLVYGDNSRLKTIFKKINEQPNARELREQVSDSFIRDTVPTNPLVLEAKNDIRSFLDMFGDANDLRERKFFIDKYFPLIADMENTYLKVKGMFGNIDNNTPYEKTNNPRGLPERYIQAGQSALSNEEFAELKTIFAKNKTWKELSNLEKNRIRYNVLDFEGIYDQWAFLPSDQMEKTNSKTFNPHLQERTGGELLAYKHDSQEVLSQYLYTMINKESDRIFKQEVKPLIDKYPRGDVFRSVRWYMEKQVKQALGTRTIGARWLSNEVERLNNVIGQEVLSPNFPNIMAGRLAGQVARGAIGPDTALRNVLQSTQTLVRDGPGAFVKGLHSYLNYLKGKGDPEVKKMFDILLGAEEYYEEVGPGGKGLKARLARAETIPGKGLAFYDWVSDMAMSPMRATEHFNKFQAFQTALSEAGEKGWSFEKGVRLGLLRSMDMVPDLEIPNAYWNAFKSTIESNYGYSKTMRNPLTRGPLAKLSTIFWSYPGNTVQFIARGLTDGIGNGDMAKTTRFGLYLGFQVSIAVAMAKLGMDVSSIFGQGLMPVQALSIPWKILKGAYTATFGGTAAERSSAVDDLLNALGILGIPQYRYGAKVLKTVTDLENGYKAAGKQKLETMETSPFAAIMDLTGFPYIGPKATYDLVQQLRDQAYEYGKSKQELVLRGIQAMEKGKMGDVQKVFTDAKDKNVVLTYAELSKYYNIHKTKTYLQSNLERLPKHLRPAMQTRVRELEEQLMPHKFGKAENVAGRSLWSAPSQLEGE